MSKHFVTIRIKVVDKNKDKNKDKAEDEDEAEAEDEDQKKKKKEEVKVEYEMYDGTVLSSQQDCLYIIASSKFRDKIDSKPIEVMLPNGKLIPIERGCFDMASEDSGIIGIRCTNPTPGVECGFGMLEPIEICEDPVQEQQEVYTYSHHFKERLLTPGSTMLVEENSFDHGCGRFIHTHIGTAVVNTDGRFVGFNFSHKGYLTAYNMREVAARIEKNQGRHFKRISDTFQHLRQQCRVLGFRLCNLDVFVKIQLIGQPEDSASWKNLAEFQQQNSAFQFDEETKQEIEQAVADVRDARFGRFYVRNRNRKRAVVDAKFGRCYVRRRDRK
ncbi:uncharacterized protein LOC101786993 isoform X2 [Setaria italica]|nr:uncharacterized protein LOC101786993 isoform X2 [Setaria italica]